MASQPLIRPPSASVDQDHREVGRLVIGLFSERQHSLAGHGAALDIDRAFGEARRLKRAAYLRQIATSFITTSASIDRIRSVRLVSSSVAGTTVNTSSPKVIGMPLAVQQPDMPEMPGTTTIGAWPSRRLCRCMNDP